MKTKSRCNRKKGDNHRLEIVAKSRERLCVCGKPGDLHRTQHRPWFVSECEQANDTEKLDRVIDHFDLKWTPRPWYTPQRMGTNISGLLSVSTSHLRDSD